MKKINICSLSDILVFGEREFGIPYNKLHDIMVDADICGGEVYLDDIIHQVENYPEETDVNEMKASMVIIDFAKYHDVTEFHIAPKSWR